MAMTDSRTGVAVPPDELVGGEIHATSSAAKVE